MGSTPKRIFITLSIVISVLVSLLLMNEWLPENQFRALRNVIDYNKNSIRLAALEFRDRVAALRLTYDTWSAEINSHSDLLGGLITRLKQLKNRPWLFKYQSDVEESYFLALLQQETHPHSEVYKRAVNGTNLLHAIVAASSAASHHPYAQLFKFVLDRTENACQMSENRQYNIMHKLIAQNNLPLTEIALTHDSCKSLLSVKDNSNNTPLDYLTQSSMAELLVRHHARVDQQLIESWLTRVLANDTWSMTLEAGKIVEVLLGPVNSDLAIESVSQAFDQLLGYSKAVVPRLDTTKHTLLGRLGSAVAGSSLVSFQYVKLDRENTLLPKKEISLNMRPRERQVIVMTVSGSSSLQSKQKFRSGLITAVHSNADSFDLKLSESVNLVHMLANDPQVIRQQDTMFGAYPHVTLTAESSAFDHVTVTALITCNNAFVACKGDFSVEFVPFAEHLSNVTELTWTDFAWHPFSLFRLSAIIWLPFMEIVPKTSSSIVQLARVLPIFVSLFGFVAAGYLWAVYWICYLFVGVLLLAPLVVLRRL